MSIERRSKPVLNQRGLTLIELVIFIIIVSVALAGVLTVLNITTKSSADPMIRKQMLAIAEALMEEVQMKSFTYCDPDDANVSTATGAALGASGTGYISGSTLIISVLQRGPFKTDSTMKVTGGVTITAGPVGGGTGTYTVSPSLATPLYSVGSQGQISAVTYCANTVEVLGPDGTESRTSTAAPFDNVNDYYASGGLLLNDGFKDITGTFTAPSGYSARVDIDSKALNGITSSDCASASDCTTMNVVHIAVTVCHAATCPAGTSSDSLALESYRTRFSPNY